MERMNEPKPKTEWKAKYGGEYGNSWPRLPVEWGRYILGEDASPDQCEALGRDIEKAMSQAREEALEEAAKECERLRIYWDDERPLDNAAYRIRSLKQPEKI